MKKVNLTIDEKPVLANEGEKILWAALNNGIYIPHLCSLPQAGEPEASCRLCFVEIKGYDKPVTSCTEQVREGMIVSTRSPRVDRLVRTAFELLLTTHHLDCRNCVKRKSCELLNIARKRRFNFKATRFTKIDRNLPFDDSSPIIAFDPNKCVLCGRCVFACRFIAGIGVLGFAYRSFERRVTTFENVPLASSKCSGCGICVSFCPVGALYFKV